MPLPFPVPIRYFSDCSGNAHARTFNPALRGDFHVRSNTVRKDSRSGRSHAMKGKNLRGTVTKNIRIPRHPFQVIGVSSDNERELRESSGAQEFAGCADRRRYRLVGRYRPLQERAARRRPNHQGGIGEDRHRLEHDPEKCAAVFRRDHAQTKKLERDGVRGKSHLAPAAQAIHLARATRNISEAEHSHETDRRHLPELFCRLSADTT